MIAADREFAREAGGQTALYCDADSGSAFAQAVISLFESPEEGDRLSRLGKEHLRTTARDWPAIVREYRSLLNDIAGQFAGRADYGS